MKYPRIAAKIYAEPWLMHPARFQEMSAGFQAARRAAEQRADDPVGPDITDFWTGQKRKAHPQIQALGPVALASVHGVTGKGLSAMEMQCGGFDTTLFRAQLQNVAEDPAIRALVIDFRSPGGMAAGNSAAADSIRSVAAAGKRVYGYASTMACSAAYWMASACDEIHAEPDAIVGSISTIYAGVDSSQAWEKEGYELKLFATGKFKATGMDGKKWTEEEEANIWERVNKLDAEFKGYISSRRSLPAEHMEGQWWYARHAPAGLVDSTRFQTLDQLVEAVLETL
jgi:signal peptide peptidase SppA